MNRKATNLRKRYLFKMTSIFLAISFMGTFLCKENAHASEKPYIITTIAGTGTLGFAGDGDLATNAELIAVDSSGNVYIADRFNHRIREIDTNGNIKTIAETGTPGFAGDGGQATNAELSYPFGVAVDNSGNVYIADINNYRIRKIDKSSGKITTIAGTGDFGYTGDGGLATSAELNNPYGVAVDSTGNVYIADTYNDCVRKLTEVSSACDVTRVTTPNGAAINGSNITAAVDNSTTSLAVDVTPSADATWMLYSDSGCTQLLAGNIMSSLKVGDNTAYIKVTAQDGTTSKIYKLTVTRAASSACDITSVTTPNRAAINGSNITAAVDNSTTSLTVAVTPSADATWMLYSDSGCTQALAGNIMSSLKVGDNIAYIKVTAQDGTASKVYTLIIIRTASSTGGKVTTNSLVQTGSILNFEDIVISGLLLIVTGTILIKKKKRKATE